MAQKTKKGSGPNLSARVDPALLKRAKQRALDTDDTLQAIVNAALEEYLKKRGA